jgi:hypothetical protein
MPSGRREQTRKAHISESAAVTICPMSEPTSSDAENESAPEKPAPRPSSSHRPEAAAKPSNAIPIAALIVAIAALAVGGYALFKGMSGSEDSESAETFDTAQQDEAKKNVCAAFETIRRGVVGNTNATAPGGPEDITGGIAVAANARLSLLGGGQYLLDRLEPATPEALATDVRDFANKLMDIGATSIGGVPTSDPEQATRLTDAQTMSTNISTQCAPS